MTMDAAEIRARNANTRADGLQVQLTAILNRSSAEDTA